MALITVLRGTSANGVWKHAAFTALGTRWLNLNRAGRQTRL